jgi:3-hydroxyacyl-CoA dehydrogenase/enoyl-CoA hydratase/3-hydroxybutyryl-CoA epimerase
MPLWRRWPKTLTRVSAKNALQFICGQGVNAFAKRCAELAERYGADFAPTAEVMNSFKRHQPVY